MENIEQTFIGLSSFIFFKQTIPMHQVGFSRRMVV